MSLPILLLTGLFLPLFPLSMVFNRLFARTGSAGLRGVLLLVWPQAGLVLLTVADVQIPQWLMVWGLSTSVLYGFRVLALREVGLWTGFLATSSWALLWVAAGNGAAPSTLQAYAIAFSAPLVLLASLVAGLERRYGAAYSGLYGGLASSVPRLAAVLVLVVLAATATPVFPAFFAMLATVFATTAAAPALAVVLVLVWLLWSWAAARLLQGLVAGPVAVEPVPDLSLPSLSVYASMLGVLAAGGFYLAGGWG